MGGGQFKLYVFLSHSKNNLAMNKDNPIVTNGWKKMKKFIFWVHWQWHVVSFQHEKCRNQIKRHATRIDPKASLILLQVMGGCVVVAEALFYESRPVEMEDFVNSSSGVSVTLGKKSGKNGAAMTHLGGWAMTLDVNRNVLGMRWVELPQQRRYGCQKRRRWVPLWLEHTSDWAGNINVRPRGQIGRIWRCRGIF